MTWIILYFLAIAFNSLTHFTSISFKNLWSKLDVKLIFDGQKLSLPIYSVRLHCIMV